MNPYAVLGSDVRTAEAASLRARLSGWHDEMVAHERRLRTGRTSDRCDEKCPHAEARTLWAEALATFGTRANELAFLRSQATAASAHAERIAPTATRSEAADTVEPWSRAVLPATAGCRSRSTRRYHRERRLRSCSHDATVRYSAVTNGAFTGKWMTLEGLLHRSLGVLRTES
jgi:hypothetical protein